MGDLRLKAQELLKDKQNKKESNIILKDITREKSMKEQKEESKRVFTEKIQKEINEFQNRLLQSANNGEALKIEILRLDTDGLLSWWDEREDKFINTKYTPIKSGIVTFIDDINLDFLTDDIIIDSTLQKLYDLIKNNDIYPQWKVTKNRDGKIETLYLEVDPTISYKERRDNLHREKNINQRALVVQNYQQNIQSPTESSKLKRIKNFLLIFVSVLYFSVMILTILTKAIGLVSMSNSAISSFVEIGWPYFLIKDFSTVGELFIISLPLGILISLYFAYKKS